MALISSTITIHGQNNDNNSWLKDSGMKYNVIFKEWGILCKNICQSNQRYDIRQGCYIILVNIDIT